MKFLKKVNRKKSPHSCTSILKKMEDRKNYFYAKGLRPKMHCIGWIAFSMLDSKYIMKAIDFYEENKKSGYFYEERKK